MHTLHTYIHTYMHTYITNIHTSIQYIRTYIHTAYNTHTFMNYTYKQAQQTVTALRSGGVQVTVMRMYSLT